jgi:hypothetical protein
VALTFALAIYTGAFIAENVRAGILAISKGQTEAAAALGIRPGRIMSLVILPAGFARDHSTHDFQLLEPNQKLVTGDCGWLHGHNRHIRWHHIKPNRTRDRSDPIVDGILSCNQPWHLCDHERL